MTDDGRPLAAADAARLASLHRATLRESVLGGMDLQTVERYYRWVATSSREVLFVSRDGALVTGAAVLSHEPASVIRRFVRSAPFAFAASAVKALVADPAFRRAVRGMAQGGGGDAVDDATPEVLQIFVAADRQGRQEGTALLARVEAALAARGLGRYTVRTLADDNDPTQAFYARRGFRPVGTRVFGGARYVVLEKVMP